MKKMSPSIKKLYEAAKKARLNSYSPYSHCKVGAAIRTRSGKIYAGCNVENSSYGGGVCAERGAIQTAVGAEGKMEIRELLVISDATPPWPPCGLCRQIISEFAGQGLTIHMTNTKGQLVSMAFDALMPQAFTPEHLGK